MGLGSGIRRPGSGKNLFRIPDPGVKKGTGSRIRIRNTAFLSRSRSDRELFKIPFPSTFSQLEVGTGQTIMDITS